MILDYLFYHSIQSRLSQKHINMDNKNIIETVIHNILANHKQRKDPTIQQRLNLCQLTNLTMGRPFHVTFSAPVTHPYRFRRKIKDNIHFSKPFQPLFCRQHRQPHCCPPTTGPGLAEAIPAFLKTSANMLRSVLEQNKDVKLLTVAGQPVMGGGMPPRWYDLFLDLLTQAAIQSYMCDGHVGLETIYEIFSYGYVEDEDEEDSFDEEEEEDEDDNIWTVKAADHHLLFPKTRTMYLFKLQVRQREKEFVQVKEGDTLESHFMALEKLYPLVPFERNMCDFIQMLLENMDIPALDKCDSSCHHVTSPTIASPQDGPEELQFSLYKYPSDGSLLIPDIIQEDDVLIPQKKRTALSAELQERETNSIKRQHLPS
ncbi:hypothetical protein BCV71DRAFT_170002 [Rhizopus microsporus]|uniref:Uncharacterized protein n=1 Tax=Rhizopus microsporus TaxID=58291 RepID=A0A1X0SGD5_RHIZD|nr:hypothetical protein BCV71DRAFT_170002 [Rhizopus microsporus]